MGKIKLLLLLLFCSLTSIILAQQVTISPIPQTISWGEKAFENTTSYFLTGSQTADQDAVKLLQSKLVLNTTGVEIIIGEKEDSAVAEYIAEVPDFNEAYFLKIETGRIIIVGADESGTFYGVQSLLQILSSPEVMSVTIKDYPNVTERGIIEGYYGNPYSHQARQRLFRFFGENKMNVYIYGPKDDPYHGFGTKWRDPYPSAQAAQMKELIDAAHQNKVNFVWAVHPGNNISWTDNNSDGIVDDFVACKNKFQLMYDLGVRSFAVFFDDIGGVGADPVNQAKMMNYLTTEFVNKKTDVSPLLLCPTQYNKSWSSGTYLSILGTQMDKSVRIMWTGNSVVDMINKSDMDWINAQISRKAYIWLNYPVTDYCVDHLLMGPTYGNDLNIASQLSGFTANPMEYAEASKVALYSIADYSWNMSKYNSNSSWQRGIKYLMPDNYDAYRVFCENNIDLGPTGHGLRRTGESAAFKTVSDAFMTDFTAGNYNPAQINALSEQFQRFINSSNELSSSTYNTYLIEEIKPWMDVFSLMGKRGEKLLNMYAALNSEDSIAFISYYLEADSLEILQGKIRSRDFPGSIKNPYPKPANEVVAPFLKQLKTRLISNYRSKFDYRTDIFPAILLESGNYYIKYNGKFLTNRNVNASGGNPEFMASKDTINPQRQEWTVSVDPITERYSIRNTQDNRYVNELGNFGTNPYEAIWHTFNFHRFSGKYAIQNAGSAGDKFWQSNGIRISLSTDNVLSNNNFLFEFVPVGQDSANHPAISFGETYFIKFNGNFLTNNAPNGSGGNPTFRVFNPASNVKTQKWIFTEDAASDRIKLVSAADNRYINELGAFGTNQYYPAWNSYLITEMGGKFAIRNAGDAGNKYWKAGTRIEAGDTGLSDSYIFEIVSDKVSTSEKKKVFSGEFSVTLNNEYFQVLGGEMKSMQLTNIHGVIIESVGNSNVINASNLAKGIYILSVVSRNGTTDTIKLLKP